MKPFANGNLVRTYKAKIWLKCGCFSRPPMNLYRFWLKIDEIRWGATGNNPTRFPFGCKTGQINVSLSNLLLLGFRIYSLQLQINVEVEDWVHMVTSANTKLLLILLSYLSDAERTFTCHLPSCSFFANLILKTLHTDPFKCNSPCYCYYYLLFVKLKMSIL